MSDSDYWGAVPGDTNAQAIISDRRDGKTGVRWGGIISGLFLLAAAIFYGTTGEPGALAWLIVCAVWAVNNTVMTELYGTHTFIMIAERRAQLLEQAVQSLRSEVTSLRSELRANPTPTRRYDYD